MRGDLPEANVRLPEFDRDRGRLRTPLAEINHASFLLGLRGLVDQQKFLSGLHSCPQHQKCSVRAHVDGVRFFVKRLLRRAVSIYEDRNIERARYLRSHLNKDDGRGAEKN